MRLISYNILNGGEGRADPLAEVIQSHHPDIVVLVEADDPAVVERIAGRLGMDFILARGRRHGGAILSRWRIVESINHSLLWEVFSDCVLEATIESPDGQSWTVAGVHLHPRAREEDEVRREAELDALLDIFSRHRREGRPHILAGDFNANSPSQKIDPERCKLKTRDEIAANGGVLPRRAVQKLLYAGYLDSLHQVCGSGADSIGSFTTQYPGQRVDYIFTFGLEPARFKTASIEQDRLAKYASDHFPAFLCIE